MVKLLRTDLAFVRFIAGMFCQVLLKYKKRGISFTFYHFRNRFIYYLRKINFIIFAQIHHSPYVIKCINWKRKGSSVFQSLMLYKILFCKMKEYYLQSTLVSNYASYIYSLIECYFVVQKVIIL